MKKIAFTLTFSLLMLVNTNADQNHPCLESFQRDALKINDAFLSDISPNEPRDSYYNVLGSQYIKVTSVPNKLRGEGSSYSNDTLKGAIEFGHQGYYDVSITYLVSRKGEEVCVKPLGFSFDMTQEK